MRRVVCALIGLALLIAGVIAGQMWLDRATGEMDGVLSAAEEAFSSEDTQDGAEALDRFGELLEEDRLLLALFCHDMHLREMDRGLSRAKRLAAEGEAELAAEETADLRQTLRDLTDLFAPTAVNLLKFRFSVENAA